MYFEVSLLEINLLKHLMKFLGVTFSVSSKYLALLTLQKKMIYAFDYLFNLVL